MSCGFGSPSAITSPRSTCSPSKTFRWRHFGISSSCFSLCSSVMIRRRLPLVSLPKLTVPVYSARIAESFGLRASNRSATRGRPPVMSRVFDDSCGIRAMTSPTDTFAPSSRLTIAPGGNAYTAGMSVFANVTSLPLAFIEAHDRTQVLAAARALLRIHHDRARQARDLVDLALHRQAFDEVLELDEARDLGHDRVRVRIPGRHDLARADRIAVADADDRAVRNLVALALATEFVDHAELAGARGRDPVALLVMHRLQVVQARRALALRFDRVRRCGSRRRATDVERAHRQLRARLADRLGRDHADRLAQVDAMTAREIAPVALRADAVARPAGDRRTHLHLVDAFLLEQLHQLLVDQRAGRDHDRFA